MIRPGSAGLPIGSEAPALVRAHRGFSHRAAIVLRPIAGDRERHGDIEHAFAEQSPGPEVTTGVGCIGFYTITAGRGRNRRA